MSWKIIIQAMNDFDVEFPASNDLENVKPFGILLSENDALCQNTNNYIGNPHQASSSSIINIPINIPQQISVQYQEDNENLFGYDIQDAHRSYSNTSKLDQNFPQCNLTNNHLFPHSNRAGSSKALDKTNGGSLPTFLSTFKHPPMLAQQSCSYASNVVSQPVKFQGIEQVSHINENYFMEANMNISHPPPVLHSMKKQGEQNNVNLNNNYANRETEFLNGRRFKCETCTKTFKQKKHLVRHYHTHSGEKLFKCETCTKAFAQKIDLLRHCRTHTGEKPFKCETCTRAFTQKSSLLSHYRTHTGEKPFKCETCTKAFAQKKDLLRHDRIHTGAKPFKCDSCTRAFTRKSLLVRHIQTHT